ncbi:MAG: 6-phosphogluconolactonase [Desulfobulbaceae bacterium]|nr:6-phosphogluconolactonase [Desulfobulbaceae bacterium]
MNRHEFLEFSTAELLVETLATRIGDLLTEGVRKRAQASLLVSGGSTPIPLFARLAGMELPWQHVTISLVDERWVEPTSRDSNESLVRTHLLQKKAAAARFIPMKTEDGTAAEGEEHCAAALVEIPRPYDCLILGMGNDGHTASLFPGAGNLAAAVDPRSAKICMAMRPQTAPYERMTLTLPAILNSRQLFLHLQGEEKKKVLVKAQEAEDAREMPIRYLLRQETTPLAVYWSP